MGFDFDIGAALSGMVSNVIKSLPDIAANVGKKVLTAVATAKLTSALAPKATTPPAQKQLAEAAVALGVPVEQAAVLATGGTVRSMAPWGYAAIAGGAVLLFGVGYLALRKR
jgi:hypothetical protein